MRNIAKFALLGVLGLAAGWLSAQTNQGPFNTPQMNSTLYVGSLSANQFYPTIQSAVTSACHAGARRTVEIPVAYSGSDVISSVTGGCTNTGLVDKRAFPWVCYTWQGGSSYSSASVNCTGSGGSGMVYPAAGVPLSTGSAWATSLTAPTGALVGTTDIQTLTNKTVDGVSPATMAFVDATSSIQTQLNAKLPTASYVPFIGSGTGHAPGIVPDPGASAGTSRYLREDGSFAVPPGSAFTYPSAGVAVSTGTAWATSLSLAGSGAGVVTGPTTATNGHLAGFTGTGGQLADSGFSPGSFIASGAATTINSTVCSVNGTCFLASGSTIAALYGFGTSIMYGSGTQVPGQQSFFSLLAATTSGYAYNFGVASSSLSDDLGYEFSNYQPSFQYPVAMAFESGENDPACSTAACHTNVQNQYSAADAWVAINPNYQILASTVTHTNWAYNSIWPILTPASVASRGTNEYTTTSGSTLTFTIPTSTSPVVGLIYGVKNSLGGTFTVSVDGTPVTDDCSGTTTFSSTPCASISAGASSSFYRQQWSVTSGTSHTIVVTATNTGGVAILAADWIPPANNGIINVVIHQSILANYASAATLNTDALAVTTALKAAGLAVVYVDQTGVTNTCGTFTPCPGVNTTTDIATSATAACAATALTGHPNACGNIHDFQTIIASEQAAGISIGSINVIGKSVQNTGNFLSALTVGNCPSGSNYYNVLNCGFTGQTSAGVIYYNFSGNAFGIGWGQSLSNTGAPFYGAFVNRMFVGSLTAWNCMSQYNASGLDANGNYTERFCAKNSTGETYQTGAQTIYTNTAAGVVATYTNTNVTGISGFSMNNASNATAGGFGYANPSFSTALLANNVYVYAQGYPFCLDMTDPGGKCALSFLASSNTGTFNGQMNFLLAGSGSSSYTAVFGNTTANTGTQIEFSGESGVSYPWVLSTLATNGLQVSSLSGTATMTLLDSGLGSWSGAWKSTVSEQNVGTAIASAATIAPTSGVTHITGTNTIQTITPPLGMSSTYGGSLTLIADAAWSTNTIGNIATTMTAAAGVQYTATYDGSKWYIK